MVFSRAEQSSLLTCIWCAKGNQLIKSAIASLLATLL